MRYKYLMKQPNQAQQALEGEVGQLKITSSVIEEETKEKQSANDSHRKKEELSAEFEEKRLNLSVAELISKRLGVLLEIELEQEMELPVL